MHQQTRTPYYTARTTVYTSRATTRCSGCSSCKRSLRSMRRRSTTCCSSFPVHAGACRAFSPPLTARAQGGDCLWGPFTSRRAGRGPRAALPPARRVLVRRELLPDGRTRRHTRPRQPLQQPLQAPRGRLAGPCPGRIRAEALPLILPPRPRWNKTIGAARCTGFQCVDPLSLVTFPVPVGPAPLDDPRRAMFRVDEHFLLCYDRCAFFVDKAGASSERAFGRR
ncbi:hypothetical protein B0H17DRAFT_315317 [Mycena rosella]|uniref:Uncharacterized protein n=1 Tax=Mycena rosella TaxID=1033263 RepID=A0AAD7GKF2_MYCRO|nr:hypothetical protein B0H17DRAFT_315317 [Mycena rosella]